MNSVHLIGRLGKDPKTFGDVTKFTIATGEGEYTNWVPITVFGKLAALCGEYLAKGRQVAIEATVRQESYTTKDGAKRYDTVVVANRVTFLDKPGQQPAEEPAHN